jgi:hypothetical protein
MKTRCSLQNRRRFVQDWNRSKRKGKHGKCPVVFCEKTVISPGMNPAAVADNRKSLCNVFACCPRDSETGCVLACGQISGSIYRAFKFQFTQLFY